MVNILLIRFQHWIRKLPSFHDNRSPLYAGHRLSSDKSPEKEIGLRLLDYLYPAGFTLIELSIAIAVVGILATIAAPNVLTEMPKFRLNGAAQQIFGDLMAARMKAVSHNRKVKIFFTDDNQYKICDDADNDGSVDDCEGESKVVDINENYKGITLSSNNNPIFNPRGTASNLATINIENLSGTRCITIAITGRVRINSCPD
jgi:prepilin-type N-terminal cleavage/methylation domain-containing protein